MLYTVVIALGSYFIGLQFFIHSYCHGSRSKPQIAITFDDGPLLSHTAAILDILKQEKAPAAFFLIGKNILGQEQMIKEINAQGHLIGTHSYSHHWRFPLQPVSKISAEIEASQKMVSDIIFRKPLLFRPPFGVTDPLLASAIKACKVYSIGWSLRTYDTVITSSDKLLKRASHIQNGDIILFHDNGLQTNVILPLFIQNVRKQGFEIVPLDQLLGIKAYEN